VKECLLGSESEESLSDSEFDSENELDDCVLLDVVVDDNSDESLTLWKVRLSFKQYILLKASVFGIKTYELCDAITGYLWSFLVYAGKDTELDFPLITADTNKTTAIVLKLVEPLLKQGRTVWKDKFYNSPCLAEVLKTVYKTDCVGTLKLNQKHCSKKVKDMKLKKV
jgi:hypothetical protein